MLNSESFNRLATDFYDVLKNNNIFLKQSIWEEFEFYIKNHNNSNELYLQIRITINSKIFQSTCSEKKSNIKDNVNESINQLNSLLDYDEYTVIGTSAFLNDQQYILNGTIDIILHPTYKVPCPYLRLWYQETGRLIDLFEIKRLMKLFDDRKSKFKNDENHVSNHINHNNIYNDDILDHRIYKFGQLENEIHPITDIPCYSIHVCILQDLMEESVWTYHNRYEKLNKLPDLTSINFNLYHSLYLLNWISLVGNSIGFHVTAEDYVNISKLLCI